MTFILPPLPAVTEFTGSIPRLFPSGEEQIYRTGASFRLTCEATKPVEWKQPILSVIFFYAIKLLQILVEAY